MNKVNKMIKMKRSFHRKLTGLFLATALLLSAAGCGSAGAGGDQPGHGKWINSNLPDNASLCAEQRLQDDFAAAVNAEWTMAQNFDPSESYGGIADSERIVNQRIIDVLKDPTDHDPNVEKLRTFYDIYTDWEYRDQLGIEPLRAYLGYIDEIHSIEDVYQYMMDCSKNPFAAMLFKCSMDQREHLVIQINQSDYSLGESNRYVMLGEDGLQKKEQVKNKIHYMMGRLGYSEEEADTLIDRNFAFELKMAELSPGGEIFVNLSDEVPLSEVVNATGDFPIQRILEHFGMDKVAGYCVDVDYLKGLSGICTEKNLEEIKAYFKVYLMWKSMRYLDHECFLKEKEIKLDRTNPYDEVVETPMDTYFNREVLNSPLSALRDQIYLDRFYSEEEKNEIETMCRDFIKEYRNIIMEKDWLSQENKERICGKLDAIRFLIMKPDNEADYSDLCLKSKGEGGTILDAVSEINRCNLETMGKLPTGEVDRDYWNIYDTNYSTTTPNGMYLRSRNVFIIQLGIVTGEFYSKDMSYEEKLGRIGDVIGHELTHAFDSGGVEFDSEGKPNPVIEGSDMSTFKKKAGKVQEYYSKIVFPDGSWSYDGTHDITTEAIADMGGVKCALKLAEKVQGFDYDKYFRARAAISRRLLSKSNAVRLIQNDEHPLEYLRCNIALQQFDEFNETYDIKPGDGMYLAPEDRIAVW